jgi:hypothetical protein
MSRKNYPTNDEFKRIVHPLDFKRVKDYKDWARGNRSDLPQSPDGVDMPIDAPAFYNRLCNQRLNNLTLAELIETFHGIVKSVGGRARNVSWIRSSKYSWMAEKVKAHGLIWEDFLLLTEGPINLSDEDLMP